MKCPKCAYLGFDTSDRCRNCGYDFSLIASSEPAAELSLHIDTASPGQTPWPDAMDYALAVPASAGATAAAAAPSRSATIVSDAFGGGANRPTGHPTPGPDVSLTLPARHKSSASATTGAQATAAATALSLEPTLPPPSFRGEPALPLFGTPGLAEDEPLIKVPAAPRAPLAVRRTPDTPRLRALPKPIERAAEPKLDFADEPAAAVPPATPAPARASTPAVAYQFETSSAGSRLLAAVIDHGILLAIDAVVLYLTLRIASLSMSEWRALPVLPMITFLALLKLSYFTAFTCVGGQTIGKMAAHIRVISDDQQPIGAAHAVHRALAGAVSFVILGAGFVPALIGADRRALHDRLAHTRVVTLPTA